MKKNSPHTHLSKGPSFEGIFYLGYCASPCDKGLRVELVEIFLPHLSPEALDTG